MFFGSIRGPQVNGSQHVRCLGKACTLVPRQSRWVLKSNSKMTVEYWMYMFCIVRDLCYVDEMEGIFARAC